MSKIILSIETSSSICGVSIIENGNLLGIEERSIFRKHNENLAGFADKAINKSNRSELWKRLCDETWPTTSFRC